MSELNSIFHIEHALCSLCKNYLSRSPIFILPDGKSVCEDCSTMNNHDNLYRQFNLEKILSNVLFPCQNEKYGCKETYKYGTRSNHDEMCLFKQIKCTFSDMFNCDWKGPITTFEDHVKDHPSIIQESTTFDIKLNCDEQRAFIVSKNDIFYLFNYKYESSNFFLTINITYYTLTEEKQFFCKVQLTNTCDTDFNIQFKQSISVQHYDGLVNENFGKRIDLGPFIPTLNNPESLTIFVSADSIQKRKNEDVVNYEILDVNRCYKCNYYLILPIFVYYSNLICNYCCCDFGLTKPVNSEKSLFLENQNYPCRWNNCNQISKGNLIGDHEIMCPHRIYSCLYVDCLNARLAGLLRFDFKQHLTKDHEYFEQEIEQKVLQNDAVGYLCTAVNHEFELIKISFISGKFEIICLTTSHNKDKINTRIKFKHSHCRAVSKTFTLSAKKINNVPMCDLPMCFKKDEEIIAVITAF